MKHAKHVVAEVDDVTAVRTKATMLLYPSRVIGMGCAVARVLNSCR